MTESFSSCEYFATDARILGVNQLAEQAAAQGITYFVSTGDSGAEGCDDPNNPPATGPISVNVLASTPFNVAVGGTMFNEGGNLSKYWTNSPPISETAISYIPEDVWNESSLTNGLWSSSGGASAGNFGDNQITPPGTTKGVPKPSWQSGLSSIPNDLVRDLPDVSLTAAAHDSYLLCLEGSCVPNGQGEILVYFISGTSASAPSFAGIMALVDQSAGGRQGQANYVLYPLAASQAIYPSGCNGSAGTPASTCIFNDVTVGNNVVPGEVGNFYQAGAGYDLTTGLGSVNVSNLVTNWSTVQFNPTTTALALNGGTSLVTNTHGQSIAVDATVTPNSGATMPTGEVTLLFGYINAGGSTLDLFPLNGGKALGSTNSVPEGPAGYFYVWAHYSGDGTYAPSDSSRIGVNVNPEPSTTTLSLRVNSLNGNPLTNPYPFGSLVFVRADVAGKSGFGVPTGTVTFTDSFGPLPTVNPQVNPPVPVLSNPPLNSQGNNSIGDGVISFDAGNHSVSASYGGDPSFNGSTSTTPVTFTVQPGFAAVSGLAPAVISAPGGTGTTSVGIVASTGFPTAITFTCSNLPSETTCSSASATGQGPTTVVNTTILITTTAPHTTAVRSGERRIYYAALLGGVPLAGLFLIAIPRRRRCGVLMGLMMLVLLVTVPSCGGGGGGGGGGQQDPGTPAGTFTVTVTATAGTLSQSGNLTLVVK